jgi:cyanophycinase
MLRTLILLLFIACDLDARAVRYVTGNPADVNPALHGPVLNLAGGSTDQDQGMQWMIDQARGCMNCETRLDVVVLRASGADGYNGYLYAMNGVDSVETIVFDSRSEANRHDLVETVRHAEVVFFAGGDQCNYVRYFRSTKIHQAVEHVYHKGGAIGGTSAGCAIMGEFTFDACSDTVKSNEALANPYSKNVSLTYDFFRWKHLEDTITDQHFVARDRMGRLLVFLARIIQEGKANPVLGVAVEQKAAVLIDPDGMARVIGSGPAYFILADHKPEVCKRGEPLTYSNYKFWKVESGGTFDLKNRPVAGYYLRSVEKGRYDSNPYSP